LGQLPDVRFLKRAGQSDDIATSKCNEHVALSVKRDVPGERKNGRELDEINHCALLREPVDLVLIRAEENRSILLHRNAVILVQGVRNVVRYVDCTQK
jgi:hypothetical protein